MPQIYYTQPTTVTVNWSTTGDKTLLQITDNLPSGNKVVIFALGWDVATSVSARGYLQIVSGGTTLVQEGITHYLNFGAMKATHVMLCAYHSNAPANAQYTFIATVTTAASGTSTLHVQGMVILLDSDGFFATGINTNIAAGSTVDLATVNTSYAAGSKVVVLAYVVMGVTSTTSIHRLYAAGNIRILKGSTNVSSNQYQVGTYNNLFPALVSISYFDSNSGSNQSYTLQVYNSLTEASQAWGEIIAFQVVDGAFLDTGSVALSSGSQVTVGSLSTNLAGEVGVIALAAAENTSGTAGTAFNAGDVVLQLNDSATGQIGNQRDWYLNATSYVGRSGVYPLFRVDSGVANPSYQVKMTARLSGINGEAKILAFILEIAIKKQFSETVNLQEGVVRVVWKFKRVGETLNLLEGAVRSLRKVRIIGELLNVSEAFISLRNRFRQIVESVNLTELTARAARKFRTVAETINITEAVKALRGRFRQIGESLNITEAVFRSRIMVRSVIETLNITEAVYRSRIMIRQVGEALNVLEAVKVLRSRFRSVGEALNISEIVGRVKGRSFYFIEQLNITEASKQLRNRFRQIIETVQLGEQIGRARSLLRLVGEQINISEIGKTLKGLTRQIGESLQVSELVSRVSGRFRVVGELVNITEAGRVVRSLARQLAEQVRIAESTAFSRFRFRLVSETIHVGEVIRSKAIRILARLVASLGKVRGEGSRA